MDLADDTWLDPERLEVLSREQCRDLLASVPVSRVAFCLDGVPTVLPVNHVVDAWSVAFRTSYGSTLNSAVRGQRVAIEADEWDAERRTGWSVLARGPAEHVTDQDRIRRLEGFDLDVWADGVDRSRWVRVPLDDLSGRRIPAPDDPRTGPGPGS